MIRQLFIVIVLRHTYNMFANYLLQLIYKLVSTSLCCNVQLCVSCILLPSDRKSSQGCQQTTSSGQKCTFTDSQKWKMEKPCLVTQSSSLPEQNWSLQYLLSASVFFSMLGDGAFNTSLVNLCYSQLYLTVRKFFLRFSLKFSLC